MSTLFNRRPKSGTVISVVLMTLMWGCGAEEAGGDAQLDRRIDLDGSLDAKVGIEWDSDVSKPVKPWDFGIESDSDIPTCLAEQGSLKAVDVQVFSPGAYHVQADLDANGDGNPDIAVWIKDDIGSITFRVFDGRSAEQIGQIRLGPAERAELLPNRSPRPTLLAPITLPEMQNAWVFLVHRVRGETDLFLSELDGESTLISLPRGAAQVNLLAAGDTWHALINEAQDEDERSGCTIYTLPQDNTPLEQGLCTLQQGWDANGDGTLEIIRKGAVSTELLDGHNFDLIASFAGDGLQLGFEPSGPSNLREAGPEVAAFSLSHGDLAVRFLSDDLIPHSEPRPLPGSFIRAQFVMSADGLRLIVDEDRMNLRFLRIYALDATLRPRGEFGPFPFLNWSVQDDLDGDGFPELAIAGGPSENGTNTKLEWRSLVNGDLVSSIAAERSARFEPIFWTQNNLSSPTDLDGCPGQDQVIVRKGITDREGRTPTRLLIYGEENRLIFRGDGQSNRIREFTIADLDGQLPAELIELVDDEAGPVHLWVHSVR